MKELNTENYNRFFKLPHSLTRSARPGFLREARATIPPMKSKMTVFLSYVREDTKVAGVLRAGLSKAGFEVWDPAERLMPGDNWALHLGKALQKADAMVVLLSPAAIASAHVEIEYALGDERFKGRRAL